MNFSQKVEVCIQTLSTDSLTSSFIFRFSIRISSDREWFTSHVSWEVEINRFAETSYALVLFAQFWQMQFRKQWSSHTNSHYVISLCGDFICFRNDRIRDFQNLHMLAKIFRANSRSRFTFLDSRKFLILLQFADVVKSISSSICLAVDSHRSLREPETMKYSWKSLSWKSIGLEKSQKLFVFRTFHSLRKF